MPTWQILEGDVRARLGDLSDGSVQCVVTSPPYWGLRDYGTATWEGGDPGCEHKGRPKPRQDTTGSGAEHGRFAATRGTQASKDAYAVPVRAVCPCGARRIDAQLGLEPTPEAYVASMVAVFREVRRVMRDDGTLWLNLGDCYANKSTEPHHDKGTFRNGSGSGQGLTSWTHRGQPTPNTVAPGLKTKDLVGIPWRVAFALQADGWWLRSDIIWAKPNPMPESVTDRPTKAHEYLFLLTKSARYYYDAEAIRERSLQPPGEPKRAGQETEKAESRRSQKRVSNKNGTGSSILGSNQGSVHRNARTVWTIPTQPFPGAHFAVFPPQLVEPCVKAGSKIGDMVLDPFAGAGTTLMVAIDHGRNAVGIELNPDYAAMARKRLRERNPLFAKEIVDEMAQAE